MSSKKFTHILLLKNDVGLKKKVTNIQEKKNNHPNLKNKNKNHVKKITSKKKKKKKLPRPRKSKEEEKKKGNVAQTQKNKIESNKAMLEKKIIT